MNNVPPSPRLTLLGFKHDPFQPLAAERMSAESLESTFVAHPGWDKYIMNLDSSAVLLAQRGGGKTASRLYLAANLQNRQERYFSYGLQTGSPPYAPLVVSYTDFQRLTDHFPTEAERLAGKLPEIHLKDHTGPLMAAIAKSLATFILTYPAHFQNSSEKIREKNLSFLNRYLRRGWLAETLAEELPDYRSQKEEGVLSPVPADDTLEELFEDLAQSLKGLGLDKLVILIDNVNGYTETGAPAYQAALVSPLLNTLALLSLEDVTWKFFLPVDIELWVNQSGGRQTRRLDVVSMIWNEESLKKLLEERMKDASESGGPLTITRMATDALQQQGVDLEAALIQRARHHPELGPPQALLELAGFLFEDRACETEEEAKLSLADWEKFVRLQRSKTEELNDRTTSLPTYRKQDQDDLRRSFSPALSSEELERLMVGLGVDLEIFARLQRSKIEELKDRSAALATYWTNNQTELRRRIEPVFSIEELKPLMREMRIDPGNIGGEDKTNKIDELIAYVIRRAHLPELITCLLKERPRHDWDPPRSET